MKKKIFSLLLAVCVMLAFMPTMAFAANPNTDLTLTADKTQVTVWRYCYSIFESSEF